MTQPLTPLERMRRYRQRQAGVLEPVARFSCSSCGRSHRGIHDPYCSRCWAKLTPEGRADRLERVTMSRRRKRRQSGSVTDGEAV